MNRLFVTLLFFILPVSFVFAEYQRANNGMVSSRSDIASEVGKEILEQGGNAIDAAVATGFALAVTYPSAGNLGGGGFMILSLADGEVISLDFREKAPAAAHRDMYLDADGNVNRNLSRSSRQSSGVPGSVAGLLAALEKYGSMSTEQVLAPAIRLAAEGFILNSDLAGQFRGQFNNFRNHPASLGKFSKDGAPYSAGERWYQPDLPKRCRIFLPKDATVFTRGTLLSF